jgi:hypothetical protein
MSLTMFLALSLFTPQQIAGGTTAFLGVGPNENAPLTTTIEAALAGNRAVALQSRDATKQFMETAKSLDVTCDPALDQCLLQLAELCTVDQAVYAVVDARHLTLRLAVVKGATVRIVSAPVDVRTDVLAATVREAVAELVAPSTVASLVVDAPTDSVISLDGLERATAPMTSALNGIAPGQHFVDVRFPDGAVTTKSVTLTAGQRTRMIAVPRPLGADAMTWTGWGSLGVAAVSAGVATFWTGVYIVSRAQLENYSTHYGNLDEADHDLNDAATRKGAIDAQDYLTDLPAYGYPFFGTAVVAGVAGGALLIVGYRWSDLFDPPSEDTAR